LSEGDGKMMEFYVERLAFLRQIRFSILVQILTVSGRM
jgi:hypothetical protein